MRNESPNENEYEDKFGMGSVGEPKEFTPLKVEEDKEVNNLVDIK